MFDPSKTLLIANPNARHGFVGDNWPALSEQIRAALGPVDLQLTASRGDGLRIGRKAIANGVRTIISFGGDGTHSEIVDSIMESGVNEEVTLGILHAGTGGDFRKMIPGADELAGACAVIREKPAVPTDVGWVQYVHDEGHTESRFFINIASMGMGGLVDRIVGASPSKSGGKAKYFKAVLRAQMKYKPARIRLRVDGKDEGEHDISNLCVCNGRWAGGGMMFAPQARVADGMFDVILLRATSTLRGLPVMLGLYKGTHVRSAVVSTYRGRHVEVEMVANTAWMDIDGEAPGVGPAEFRIHDRALRVIGIGPEFV
ncbi:MAG: YegS/Rv2252/BmrU family lipid kinase [Myxococcales bacterium]|jgi:YegS/Rv2252/BmrU family lipid kinase|nr:YegS/Rv2252/BmrU family lipid kinase [Myxococcales bacterium]